MRGRLNLFQATMLRWRELYPYNAVHTVRVEAPLDAPRLAREIEAALETRGLAGFALDAEQLRYDYRGGRPQIDLEVIDGRNGREEALRAAIERGINIAFPQTGAFEPFQFFAVDAGATCHLGVAYDHVVAGGDSMADLLAEIALRYAGTPVTRPPPSLYPPTFRRLFVRYALSILRGLAAAPAAVQSLRRSQRPYYRFGDDRRNAFAAARIDSAGIGALHRAAKAWGVTQGDLLLALLMRAVARVAADGRQGQRRHQIGVAVIVNLRRDLGTNVRETFGQFLSSFRYAHPAPPDIALETLARELHVQTARVRRGKFYLVTLLALAGAGVVWPRLTPTQRARAYAKHYAAWAGLTPLHVDAIWRDAGASEPPREYLRAVSTGPATPLILAATSAGGEIQLGVSYRAAAFNRDDAARIVATLQQAVNELEA